MKKLVLDHECWVWYEVQADYSGPAPTPPKRVHPFETKFARRLNWSYKAKKPNDKGDRLVDEDKATIHSIPTSGKGSVPSISDGYPD